MSTASSLPRLYRQLLKSANRVSDYNVRNYAVRRIHEEFRAECPGEGGLVKANAMLDHLYIQSTISQLYNGPRSVLQ
jgi:hypothetical protein